MALTKKELEISNKSYTNKDFEAIYTELLDYAEKLSTRFSPKHSNETDPFVLLLKLVAFVTDKVNYNVDKNVLERFLVSCTQESSMRELTSMLGYNMHYYRSAETSVLFKYTGESKTFNSAISIPQFSIVTNNDTIQYVTTQATAIDPRTKISSSVPVIQGKLKTLTVLGSNVIRLENLDANNRIYFPETLVAENGIFIQRSSNIWKAVENLNTQAYGSAVYKFNFDSNTGLPYLEFPQWISDIIGAGFTIRYIVTDGVQGNVKAKELCHITRINVSDEDKIDDADIAVQNLSAAKSGENPETISESYEGFKKIIGTFDTLVTCRDYANKIYSMLNEANLPLVSNVQVSDRRSDINYGCDVLLADKTDLQSSSIISKKISHIIDLDSAGFPKASSNYKNQIWYHINLNSYKKCVPEGSSWKWIDITNSDNNLYSDIRKILNKNSKENIPEELNNKIVYFVEEDLYYKYNSAATKAPYWIPINISDIPDSISANDLCIYGLNPLQNDSYFAIKENNGFDHSFTPIDHAVKYDIENILENSKCISHDYKEFKKDDILAIQNYYTINAIISTTAKVNVLEQQDILLNINNALISNYNPRNLNFGSEIVFDELLAVIEHADSRIKAVSLQEPEQQPLIMTAASDPDISTSLKFIETPIYNEQHLASNSFKFIVAKNILSGRVAAFSYDTDFDYSYTYKNLYKQPNIRYITSYANLPALSNDTVYELKENECIQLIAPKLLDDQRFIYQVMYYLHLNSGKQINKNAMYRLQKGDQFVVCFGDDDGDLQAQEFAPGSIICPNFDLQATDIRTDNMHTRVGVDNSEKYAKYSTYKFYALNINEEIVSKKYNYEFFNSTKKCYWLTNQTNNRINWSKVSSTTSGLSYNYYEYILNENEYFFYTDIDLSVLISYGSGSRLVISENLYNETYGKNPDYWTHNDYLAADSITKEGLAALASVFMTIPFNSTSYMKIYINDIITLTCKDSIVINNLSDNYVIQNNQFEYLPDNAAVRYKFFTDSSEQILPDRSSLAEDGKEYTWAIRALLDIKAGPENAQSIKDNQVIRLTLGKWNAEKEEYDSDIILDLYNAETKPEILNASPSDQDVRISQFKFNSIIQTGGGIDIDLQYVGPDLNKHCPSLLGFDLDADVVNDLKKYSNNFYGIDFANDTIQEDALSGVSHILYTQPITSSDGSLCDRYIGIQVVGELDKYPGTTISLQAQNVKIEDNIESATAVAALNVINSPTSILNATAINLHPGLNIIQIQDKQLADKCNRIAIQLNNLPVDPQAVADLQNSTQLILSKLSAVKGINPLLGLSEDDDIISYMRRNFPEQLKQVYLLGNIDTAKAIELSESFKLNSAQAFYDYNNIANKWMITKINFAKNDIRIAYSSKK